MERFTKKVLFCQSMFHANSPYLYSCFWDHQSKLTLMSESLRNDGRIWVPKKYEDVKAIQEGNLKLQNYRRE